MIGFVKVIALEASKQEALRSIALKVSGKVKVSSKFNLPIIPVLLLILRTPIPPPPPPLPPPEPAAD